MLEEQVKKIKEAKIEEKRELISNLGIYELRALARVLGVPSPTTKKRDFLVDAILELISSDNIDIPKKSNKGRPYKKLESIDNIINIIGENDIKIVDVPKTYSYEDIVAFAQEIPVFEYDIKESIKKRGVLRLLKKSPYFIDFEDSSLVFISNEIISKNNLQNGDLIEAFAYKINENNQFSVKELISINKVKASDYLDIPTYDLGEKVLPILNKYLNNKSIVLGGRNVLLIQDPLFLEEEAVGIMNSLVSPENELVFLGLNLCVEDKILLNNKEGIIKFTTDYGKDNCSKNFDKIIDAINLCQRLTAIGKNVVMIVYDVLSLVNALDLYFSNSDGVQIMGHYQQSNIIIEKLVSLASAYSNGKDCTQLLICNTLDINDIFIRNQVLKISRIIK